MTSAATVTLPGGLWIDGVCHTAAELLSVTGRDEAHIAEMSDNLPAQVTTAQLARCITRIGAVEGITPEVTRSLTIGDREALLLHLRRLTLGNELQCIANCPGADCGSKMDLTLKVSDLLLPPYFPKQEFHETTIAGDGEAYHVLFRMPTGADQEDAAVLALTDADAGVDLIFQRCTRELTTENGKHLNHLPDLVRAELPSIISGLDPQAELQLNLVCPSCGRSFSAIFDTGSCFFLELTKGRNLYREVHLLAYHYHWSESEIMAMTSKKRRLYLELLDEEFGEAKLG